MAPRRILITGSRSWNDPHRLDTEIDRYITEHSGITVGANGHPADIDEWVIVHGACPTGADALADDYATRNWLEVEPYPANWKRWGKAAGLLRNGDMVHAGADVCLAFITPCRKPTCPTPRPHGSHGATHCADLAEDEGIETRRFTESTL